MTLLPYLVSFITSTIAWSLGKQLGGNWLGAVLSILAGILGWYYTRNYVKNLLNQ